MAGSTEASGVASAPSLNRVLGTLDVVLLNVAAIVGLRWLSVAAQIGPSSLTLWLLGMLTYMVPSALVVLELGARLPGDGGFYLWSKAAFGPLHAFIAGWSYWISNLVYFPSMLLFGAGALLYVHGGSWLTLADSRSYNAVFCLAALWLATGLNILGLRRAKWLQNVGGISTWLVAALIVAGGAIAWFRFGSATPLPAHSLIPRLGSTSNLASFSAIAFAFAGLELGAILGGEIKDARRTMARSLLLSCLGIAAVYMVGTLALLVALPAQNINAITGVTQALTAVAERINLPLFAGTAALLLTVSQVGGLGAWITGSARLPFLFGLDRALPRRLGAVHRKYQSPYVALIVQGLLVTVVLAASLWGAGVREAYLAMVDMTVILTFVPMLYMFAALPVIRYRQRHEVVQSWQVPGGVAGCVLVGGCGFAVTALAIGLAMIPPDDVAHPGVFALKVIGGSVVFVAIGLAFYLTGQRRTGV